MSLTSGPKIKFLAAIFVLLCAISTCLSSPIRHPQSTAEQLKRRALEEKVQLLTRASKGCADLLSDKDKRGDNPDGPKFKAFFKKLHDKNAILVGVGEQKFEPFKDKNVIFGSSGFDGCIGIVISSPKGGIIAHYTATEAATKEGTAALKDLIKKHKDAFDPKETEAWVYANVNVHNHNEFMDKNQKDTFVKLIKDELKVDAKIEKYLQTGDILEKELDEIMEDAAEDLDMAIGQIRELFSGEILLENEGKGQASKVSFVNLKVQNEKKPGGKSCPA
ncbi:hypothetical protein FQN54_003659 [Arachnomyces sp. PD_36]|nr:hypothetical protein FQN54_003659 [Arachnomyces sp. PD_36]